MLANRALALRRARAFFEERNILEVDPPALSRYANIDQHIDPIVAETFSGPRYLFTSPEHPMKRLLAAGSPDIYFLGHVFRDGEKGRHHNPEFTMAEWYRKNFSFEEMIEETLDFCRLFIGNRPLERFSYKEAFEKFAHQNSDQLSDDEGFLLMATVIEPAFSKEHLTIITDFPASQAALAEVQDNRAKRFEIFSEGLELANGYLELRQSLEQRARFDQTNELRITASKKALPIDSSFIEALEHGFPACSGVAVGFDRLLMIQEKVSSLESVQPFTWDHA